MKDFLKHLFVPHEGNDHAPHILGELSALVILFIVAMGIGGHILFSSVLSTNNNLAAIYSAVLTDLANADRVQNSLPTVTTNTLLTEAAQNKANDMAKRGYFSHNTPEGLTPWYWIEGVGYKFVYAGENLAVDFDDSVQVENAWMNSPGHRANILSSHFTEVGIASASGMYQGRPAIFVVEMFGSPQTTKSISSFIPALSKPKPVVAKVVSTTTSASVAGTSTTLSTKDLAVVASTTEYIEVKNVKGEQVAAADLAPNSWYEKFLEILTSPSTIIRVVYEILIGLILIALFIFLLVESKEKKWKHFAYGALLLVIILAALYLHLSFFTGTIAAL